jgi:hypothetical protein
LAVIVGLHVRARGEDRRSGVVIVEGGCVAAMTVGRTMAMNMQ